MWLLARPSLSPLCGSNAMRFSPLRGSLARWSLSPLGGSLSLTMGLYPNWPMYLSAVRASPNIANADRRWVPPWEVANSWWPRSEFIFEARSFDQHRAPPWWRLIPVIEPYPCVKIFNLWLVSSAKSQLLRLITHMLVVLSLLEYYALVKFFNFLQGLSSHLVRKVCSYMFCWTAILPCKMSITTAFAILMRMLGLNLVGKHARKYVSINTVPPPPPAPNIPWEALSGIQPVMAKGLVVSHRTAPMGCHLVRVSRSPTAMARDC